MDLPSKKAKVETHSEKKINGDISSIFRKVGHTKVKIIRNSKQNSHILEMLLEMTG